MAHFTIQSATNPYFADPEQTRIHLTVKFEGFDEPMPFMAVANDPEEHGRTLHANAMAGLYGPVQPYVEPEDNWAAMSVGKLYTTLAQQDHISRREALKAVSDKELPSLMRHEIDQMDEDEAFAAEMHMTSASAFAPTDPILRKVLGALTDDEYKALRKAKK